jgi:hypothetical protein
MTSKSARREYLQAVADFERACRQFSQSMGEILEPASEETDVSMRFIVSELGPARPAKRAPQEAATLALRRRAR